MTNIIYQSSRITVTRHTPDSIKILHNWLRLDHFSFYRPCLNEMCPTVFELIERLSCLEQLSPPIELEVLIEHTPTKSPIGFMSLSGIDYFNSKAEFSIGFVRGWGTRCVIEAIHFAFVQAFTVLNLRKLIFYVADSNVSVLRLLSQSPIFQEGFLRQELQRNSGAMIDLYRFALLASDWEQSNLRKRLQQLAPLKQ